jgi:bifunctional non-homologous end joining protein LigD
MPRNTNIARDNSIRAYRAKRDFTVTPEPTPRDSTTKGKQHLFVVQKHVARSPHWDFRLEYGGVLWSWAVPKGPSLHPADKRLAIHVEDHPLDYANFEGTIPEGQYGAGTVEIWDRGTWTPEGDPEAGLRNGELKFKLNGQRLKGGFVLVRLKPRDRDRNENWLLINERNEYARAGATAEAIEHEPVPQPVRTRAATARSERRGHATAPLP